MEAKEKIGQILKEANKTAQEIAYFSEGRFNQGEIDGVYQDAYLAIYQAGTREVVEWLSVNDRLPSGQWNVNHPWLSEEVLIANSCSISIGFYSREDGYWYVDTPAKGNRIDKITHWMPLPVNPHDELISKEKVGD